MSSKSDVYVNAIVVFAGKQSEDISPEYTSQHISPRVYPSHPKKVYLFSACRIESFQPEAGLSAVKQLMMADKTEVIKTTEKVWPGQLQQLPKDKGIEQLLVSAGKETGQRFSKVEPDTVMCDVSGSPEKIKDDLFFDINAVTTRQKGSTIHNTLSEVIHAEGWAGELPANALLIPGPSKTAGIARILA
ncbi:hypothetical protein M3P05_17520 [Sansalvadorimonas sp. 2012CJ34-2]|uniref:Uncharacterized protein n=1 Tax=Parendozoicomonas callyspongiae TaxID=2942213 RepID=A0ABT0PL57_9GAMM|nr:hypothetical protein [Sansalvadorimonas sp. 2012CJ34-2]MCL6271721.1 hypothetical protein [Sansalvadorimonas sp. 2012CJ34-2]